MALLPGVVVLLCPAVANGDSRLPGEALCHMGRRFGLCATTRSTVDSQTEFFARLAIESRSDGATMVREPAVPEDGVETGDDQQHQDRRGEEAEDDASGEWNQHLRLQALLGQQRQ